MNFFGTEEMKEVLQRFKNVYYSWVLNPKHVKFWKTFSIQLNSSSELFRLLFAPLILIIISNDHSGVNVFLVSKDLQRLMSVAEGERKSSR